MIAEATKMRHSISEVISTLGFNNCNKAISVISWQTSASHENTGACMWRKNETSSNRRMVIPNEVKYCLKSHCNSTLLLINPSVQCTLHSLRLHRRRSTKLLSLALLYRLLCLTLAMEYRYWAVEDKRCPGLSGRWLSSFVEATTRGYRFRLSSGYCTWWWWHCNNMRRVPLDLKNGHFGSRVFMTDATCTDFAADNWYLFKPSILSSEGSLFQKENPASHRRRVSQNPISLNTQLIFTCSTCSPLSIYGRYFWHT